MESSELFDSIYKGVNNNLPIEEAFFALFISIVLGLVLTFAYKFRYQHTKEFAISLSILPVLICSIIFLVNGNLGTSVAVAGTFSLIRFRSASGSSRELTAVFAATAIGLATGMGYVLLASVFTTIFAILMIAYDYLTFFNPPKKLRHLLVTVPVDFDQERFFERELGKACRKAELLSIKYRKKKEELILEYSLELDRNLSDSQLMRKLLVAGPKDVLINKQLPKKKIL